MGIRSADRLSENIQLPMPWQLEERLYEALSNSNTDRVAEIGLAALALEQVTQFDDKAESYRKVWELAYAGFLADA